MLLLIEFFISHKNGVINTIAFVVYSCPLYTLMTYRGAGGAAFTWWFYLVLFTSIHVVFVYKHIIIKPIIHLCKISKVLFIHV